MRTHLLLSVAASLACSLATPAPAVAQVRETVKCESVDRNYRQCPIGIAAQVDISVSRQLSDTRCVRNGTWGTYDGGIWVDGGCRAEFQVTERRSNQSYRPVGGDGGKVATCESKQGRRETCDLQNIDPASVYLERQLSSADCSQGYSWGTYDLGIWVENGCRATFHYREKSSSAWRPYAGTRYDYDFTCESTNREWVHCNVHDVNVARVTLRSGNAGCNEYKAWGTDDTGVWVRSNCRGVFQVTYRH